MVQSGIRERENSRNRTRSWSLMANFVLAAVVAGIAILAILGFVFGIDRAYRTDVSEYAASVVTRSDGRTEAGSGLSFPSLKKGDVLTVTLTGLHGTDSGSAQALCIQEANLTVKAYEGDLLIYSLDSDDTEDVGMIGDRFIVIPLSDDGGSGVVTLVFENTQRPHLTSIEMWQTPLVCAYKSLLYGHLAAFVGLLALILISTIASLVMVVLNVYMHEWKPLTWLLVFSLSIAVWNFGSFGLLYIISDSVVLASCAEYIAIFFTPFPLAMYMSVKIRKRTSKIILRVFADYFLALFLVGTVGTFSSLDLSYGTLLPTLHMSCIALLFAFLIVFAVDEKARKKAAPSLADAGFAVGMCIAFLEFLRRNIVNYFGTDVALLRHPISIYAIAVLGVTTIASIASDYAMDYAKELEARQLKRLAFQDQLTGIPNRSACYREIDAMTGWLLSGYTMLFMDLNYLKQANDEYGHEMGDNMLKAAASVLRDVFGDNGFYGRWGGDEFIACVRGPKEAGEQKAEEFREAVRKYNEREGVIIPLSVAVGSAYSSSDSPLNPQDAINRADENMYEDKKRQKAERSQSGRQPDAAAQIPASP